ncbi:MAG: DNA mismatch repair endonuclease MutL [Anaerolineae bacterium]|nr:DNA mismatch repair endonuclease MutL [Anaerolineae bacterium]
MDKPLIYNIRVPIHLLPPEIASQIAAGEVVERPASVVKELIENSLDAGANQITIHVREAGTRLVQVADNGCGISADELLLSVERHATSKLSSADDLFRIETLGFRGEALASIGSVSHLTISSRSSGAEMGCRLLVEAGVAGELKQVGIPAGTLVTVENLFFNVPARLKFLKHPSTERRHIDELVTRYAMAYPKVKFQLYQDERPVLMTSGNGNRREILAGLYGVEVARQMLEVLAEEDEASIDGFISPISLTRSNRREIVFFVNGRPVHDPALGSALVQAYHTLLMVGRYPLAMLFLHLPADTVDVNVHPTKAEVRFEDADRIFRAIQRAVRRALLAHTPIPSLGGSIHWMPPSTNGASARQIDPAWGFSADTKEDALSSVSPGLGQTIPPPAKQPGLVGASMPLLRLVGQIASTYLVAEGPDGLYLIDQHAAHERVLFESFMTMWHEARQDSLEKRTPRIPSQTLLQPVTVDLPPASARLIETELPTLNQLGFQVELFGRGSYLVRAIPAILTGMDPGAALAVIVEDFEEDETPLQAESEARIIARVCKRAAVKAGQSLTLDEQTRLLGDLEACQSPRTCPHGRPTMIHLSVDLLERQFGRRGAR